jgi:ligand-binding sensor domain-containing protein
MKISIPLFVVIVSILTACNGQVSAPDLGIAISAKPLTKFDTISELGANIMAIYQDTKGNHWFGSWESGLYKYDGKSIIHFTQQSGLPDNRVEDIQEDRLGNIYINTRKGVCKLNDNGLSRIAIASTDENDWQLHSEDMWFKDLEHGDHVYRFDGFYLYRLKLPGMSLGDEYVRKHPTYSNPYSIYCIYKDSHQHIWFGTALLGACRYNGKSFDWITEPDVTELHNGPANGVRSIAEDAQGSFWFNSEYRYVMNANAEIISGKPFYLRVKSLGSLDGKADGEIKEYLSIIRDHQNAMWIATYTNGIFKIVGENIEHYPMTADEKNVTAFCIYQDKQGTIWVGTHENGAFKLEGNSFRQFSL